MRKNVYSICAMCTVRCPIMIEVEANEIKHIWGNPHMLGGLQLCPRGAAAKAFQYDLERPQYPLIRDGERGSGKWKRATWEEALDYVADKLKGIINKYGPRSIVLSDRGGPITDFQKTFIAGIGSPNYFNHHASCSNSVHNAHMSIAGLARNSVGFDYRNCEYLVAYGRNFFESLGTKESKNVVDMLEASGKLIYIDVRWNYTANKANKFFIIKPGTDYALNLSLIHVILKEKLYDAEFAERWIKGLDELEEFVHPYTPQWAEKETGIPAGEIFTIAHEASEAKPAVVFHPGWMTAWYSNDFYF
jgi:thiosulfate reductase/polysulfide reductase chain A